MTPRALANPLSAFPRLFLLALRAHALYLLMVALYAAIGEFVVMRHGAVPFDATNATISILVCMLPLVLLAIVTLRFARLAIYERPARPTLALYRDVKAFLSEPGRLANGLAMTIALFLFMITFSHFKANIPWVNPFAWDESFAEFSRWLHFGRLPWEWLQPVLGHWPVTYALNIAYNLWFMVMWMLWVALAFATGNSVVRARFFIAFILIWSLGGTLLATIFSSAGPLFYANLGLSPDPYAGLMSYLNEVNDRIPLWALATKQMLWMSYQAKQDIISGISAMPSMHNASALLFALVGWKLNRPLGLALSVYAAVLLVASIHLGWHYSVDGYVGYLITLVAWWISGPIAVWYESLPWPRTFAAALTEDPAAGDKASAVLEPV